MITTYVIVQMNHNVGVTSILNCNSVTWYNNTVTNKVM